MKSFIDNFFLFCVKQRQLIINLFKLSYIVLFLVTVIGSYVVFTEGPFHNFFLGKAGDAGELAIPVYILTIIPGIVRRFRKNYKLVSLLMIYRRYTGILVFFMVLYHYMLERGVNTIRTLNPFDHLMVFELLGMIAFFMLFLLTVTSNDSSTKKLGVWWGRIHNLTYAIVWLMFLHTAMNELSIWSLLLGIAGVIQVSSFIYKFRH